MWEYWMVDIKTGFSKVDSSKIRCVLSNVINYINKLTSLHKKDNYIGQLLYTKDYKSIYFRNNFDSFMNRIVKDGIN